MKKFIFGLFTGLFLFYIYFFPYENQIGSEISPNGKYKLVYKAIRHGGLFPGYYRHYIEVRKISGNELVFSEFIESDDIKNPYNDAHWQEDTIVFPKGCITDRTDLPYKTVTTMGKMTFYFVKGFATE